jgi:hypothetical protein
LPWLNVIAVNAKTRRPGDKFRPEGSSTEGDDESMWRNMVLRVFAYDWSSVEFD